jgi:hypothetical protein
LYEKGRIIVGDIDMIRNENIINNDIKKISFDIVFFDKLNIINLFLFM